MVRAIVEVQLSARKCRRGIGMARNCRARNCLSGIVGAQLSCTQMSGCPAKLLWCKQSSKYESVYAALNVSCS